MTTVPPITITGGPASASPRDVLDHGPDLDEDPRGRRRRRTLAVLAGTGLLAVLVGGSELLDRRDRAEQARAQEVRDRAAVQLALPSEWDGTARYDPATDRISYEVLLDVRNEGPRAVEVLAVGLPGVQLGSPVPLSAGSTRALSLQGLYSCAGRGAEPAPESLPFQVMTEAGQRSVELPLPAGLFDTDPLAAECQRQRAEGPPAPDAGA